ncbi:MAG: class I SAM-dependent methyltransferase [Bacteroidota bacterium]|nr:class I SAM-dependent methyltransferase [Bacteroidota bacterium]
MENKKKHWENIYQTKELKDVSWYQAKPTTSLEFLEEFNVAKSAKIIDVGGGDSFFVDNLIDLGYSDIAVLDISEIALEKAKIRLGDKATRVKWIVADAASFVPTEEYDFWHDRAAFHFLTEENEINNYIKTVQNNLAVNGVLVVGTFSETGPNKCSGIEIKQYSENSISERLSLFFKKIKCITVDHETPFNTLQNFIFCGFKKISTSI